MPKLLLSPRGVPEDEAEEIDALLSEHGIDHYLVPPGNWGISGGGMPRGASPSRTLSMRFLRPVRTSLRRICWTG